MSPGDKNRRGRRDEPDFTLAWMLTLSDLTLLLLSVFVLRLSMSPLEFSRVTEKLAHFRRFAAAGPAESGVVPSGQPRKTAEITGAAREAASELNQALGPAETTPAGEGAFHFHGGISVAPVSEGFAVILSGPSFAVGISEPSFLAQEAAVRIGRLFAGRRIRMEISGHSGAELSSDTAHPSLWQLSVARAMTIARQMIDAGISAKYISVAGYADFKPCELCSGKGNSDYSRRVEILVKLAEPEGLPAQQGENGGPGKK